MASGTSQIRLSQHSTSPVKLSPFPGCFFSWWEQRGGCKPCRFGKPRGQRDRGCGRRGREGAGGRQQRAGETSGNCLFRRLWRLGYKGSEAVARLVSPSYPTQSQAAPTNIYCDATLQDCSQNEPVWLVLEVLFVLDDELWHFVI